MFPIAAASVRIDEELQVVGEGKTDFPAAAAEPDQPARLHQGVQPGGVIGRQTGRQEVLLPGFGGCRESEELIQPVLQIIHRVAPRGESLIGGKKKGEMIDGQCPKGRLPRLPGHSQENFQILAIADFDLLGILRQQIEDYVLGFRKVGQQVIKEVIRQGRRSLGERLSEAGRRRRATGSGNPAGIFIPRLLRG